MDFHLVMRMVPYNLAVIKNERQSEPCSGVYPKQIDCSRFFLHFLYHSLAACFDYATGYQ